MFFVWIKLLWNGFYRRLCLRPVVDLFGMGLVVSNSGETLDVTSMDLHFSLLLKAVVEPLGLDQLLNGWYRLKATERVMGGHSGLYARPRRILDANLTRKESVQ